MFKSFKDWLLEMKQISIEDFSKKEATEKGKLHQEWMDYVSEEMAKFAEKGVTPEALQEAVKGFVAVDALKNYVSKEDYTKLETMAKEAQKKANRAIEGLTNGDPGAGKSLAAVIKENREEIKNLITGITSKDVVLKADTVRASIATNPSGYFLPDIGQLGTKRRSLYDVLPKVTLGPGNHQGLVRYVDWDEATIARSAAVVAEGGTFPESTAKFKGYSKEVVKIGDTLPVSEEFGEDEVAAAAELEMFLDTNVRTKVDAELINGPGTAGNIEGLVAAAPAYTATASGIVAPNIYDLVKKVRTDIVFNRGSKYDPDVVVMNANTMDELHLTKDANENYIFPDASSIGSMTIIEDNNLADNVLVVGDRRYARIYEMSGIVLSRGLSGTQFVEDMETIKARTRLLMLIREVDKTGFRKVTDIDAALVTLAT